MVEQPKVDNNLLHISWCDSTWVPHLNSNNVLDYFSKCSNPFYSKDCNNEYIKMQNARMEALTQMQGTEYMLLHAQDPILYIVRKQQRLNPNHAVPLSSYHIIAGQIFQTPDVGSVINSRVASALGNINSAFTELSSFSQYHPSKGYSWHFQNKAPHQQHNEQKEKEQKEKKTNAKEEAATLFQRQRVESLLSDLLTKFPYRPPPVSVVGEHQDPQSAIGNAPQGAVTSAASQPSGAPGNPTSNALTATSSSGPTNTSPLNIKTEDIKQEDRADVKMEVKQEIKSEPSMHHQQHFQRGAKPPPEKRQRLN